MTPWGQCCVCASLCRGRNCTTCSGVCGPVSHGESTVSDRPRRYRWALYLNANIWSVIAVKCKRLVCFHLSEQRTLDEDCLTELAVHYGTGRAQIEALVSKVSMLWTYTEEAVLTVFFWTDMQLSKAPHTWFVDSFAQTLSSWVTTVFSCVKYDTNTMHLAVIFWSVLSL